MDFSVRLLSYRAKTNRDRRGHPRSIGLFFRKIAGGMRRASLKTLRIFNLARIPSETADAR
ncbi:hypothetical protein EFR84_06875 [Rhizobium chutanense]|uniref:Uncharacterized protein n=1 Tax=Rhizobium chutanense TaxID=2035448 RepID=A0A3S0R2D3_9HYPH|nr:hypothetical protein EFR84_06875 [Rhizobium chutanense]